jgi:hypothetical protein
LALLVALGDDFRILLGTLAVPTAIPPAAATIAPIRVLSLITTAAATGTAVIVPGRLIASTILATALSLPLGSTTARPTTGSPGAAEAAKAHLTSQLLHLCFVLVVERFELRLLLLFELQLFLNRGIQRQLQERTAWPAWTTASAWTAWPTTSASRPATAATGGLGRGIKRECYESNQRRR